MLIITLGDAIPACGEFEVKRPDGSDYGAVVRHPRQESMWMAMWEPRGGRDSGMKRYRTRRGAWAKVQRMAAAPWPGARLR